MQPTHHRGVAAGVLAAVSITTALLVAPVSADDFEPANHAPTVSSPAWSWPLGQSAFEPDGGSSDEVYAYSVTVGDEDSLADLDRVTLCLHHSLHEDGTSAGDGDPTCTAADPRHTVRLTWTRSTGVVELDAGVSAHWSLGTGADASVPPADLDAVSGQLLFRFRVSEVMRRGTWTASVTALDTSAASGTDASVTGDVTAYASITTRTPQTFGTVDAGTAATVTDTPTVTSNGATWLSLTAGDFASSSGSFELEASGATSDRPAAGEVTYDCNPDGSFTEGTAVRIGHTATPLGSATPTGTVEGGTTVVNTCRLIHGGGRPIDTYSFSVVNGVTSGP